MDRLIAKISSGVGSKRKSSRTPILIRLSSKRHTDELIPSGDDDSSDEEYIPEIYNEVVTKKKRKVPVKKPKREQKHQTVKFACPDSFVNDKAWSSYIPPEILLKIFQIAVNKNPDRLRLLLRASVVCKHWRAVACDPSLWDSLDLAYGWIKSPVKALSSLTVQGRLSQLQHLNLSACRKVNFEFIKFVVETFPGLKSLNIHSCENVKLEGLKLIGTGVKGLSNINISNMNKRGNLSSAIVDLLSLHKQTLEKVEMSGSAGTGVCKPLFTVISSMKHLTLLDISGSYLPEQGIMYKTLAAISSHLRVLRMSRCVRPAISSRNVSQELEDLMQTISFPNLVEFTAAETNFQIDIFINDSPKLQYLDIRGWNSLFLEKFICGTKPLPKLQCLNLRDMDLRFGFELNLARFADSLEQLDVSWIKNSAESLLDTLISSLCSADCRLKAVHCSGMPITMTQLRFLLTSCKQLETIDLESCRKVSRGMKRLYSSKADVDGLRRSVLQHTKM